MTLFHITSQAEWDRATSEGELRPESLSREGFIHLSRDRQWLEVANRLFAGRTDLVLLCIREDRLTAAVQIDPVGPESFPHLYGPLNVDAVVDAHPIPCSVGGALEIPAALRAWRHYFERE